MILTTLMFFSGAWGKMIHEKTEANNIVVTLPLTVELTVLCVDSITEAIRNFKKCFTTPNKNLGGEGA
jgi:hypothetical protein